MRRPEYFAGKPVESLQTMLRLISYADPDILPVIPNGIYDSATYASVISFQDARSQQSNGVIDQNNWQTIVNNYDQALPHRTVPSPQPSWSTAQLVKHGQFNYHIYLIQAMLIALSDFFSDLTPPTVTGTLDTVTQQGLRYVQKAGGLAETGELNTATWNYLNALYRAMIKDGSK